MLSTTETSILTRVMDSEVVQWVQDLTRIPSVWSPATGRGEEAAARWVEARCREIGLETTFEIVQPGRPNVIALHRMGDGKTLMFEGHTDVVTEGDPSLWTDPPFSATLRDGRIFGRGANDMKAGLVCAMAAMRAIAESGVRLKGTLLLGAVCDEEGQMLGIKNFVERGWADSVDAAIICEPEENHLCVEQKGVMWVRVEIGGVMAHGAMPSTGVNSAYPAARFITLVEDLEQREVSAHGSSRYLGAPSITPTIVQSPVRGAGEPQNNVMPGSCEIVLDCRLIPGQDTRQLVQHLERLVQTAISGDQRLRYVLEVLEIRPPTATDPNHPVVQSLASAYHDLTGAETVYGGVPGSTDGTILHALKGIPIVTCGPGDIHIPHHVDEWVSVEEILLAVRMYIVAAIRFLGVAEE